MSRPRSARVTGSSATSAAALGARHWLLASNMAGATFLCVGRPNVPRTARDVVFVDGVRTPFGKAGPNGLYAETRADDMVVSVIRELLRRNPALPPERVGEVAIAATTQTGDQGLTIGRSTAVLAGLPKSVPGYAIDRMCAGAMTAVTTAAGSIALGATDTAIAGGVEHMGHHPMGSGVDPNPRFISERLVAPSALVMGSTAENLHDRFGEISRDRADAYALASQQKVAAAYAASQIQPDLVPVAVRSAERGVRRPGARVRRPFQDRRRRPAGEPVGRRDRARPPARQLRRAADDPAGPPVRRAAGRPLRPDHDVRRAGHGGHRPVGEPQCLKTLDRTSRVSANRRSPRCFLAKWSPGHSSATWNCPTGRARWR